MFGRLKRKIRRNHTELAIYLLALIILSIIVAFVFHHFFYTLDNGKTRKENFELWEKSLPIAISATGFLSLLITVKIWQDTDKRQVNQAALSLFEKFRDESFIDLRRRAWLIRNKWMNEEGYKERMQEYVYDPANFYVPYDDNLYMKEFVDVRALFEFYAVLTSYTGSEDIIKSCRYFYYGWWRPFLYEVAPMHDQYYRPTTKFIEEYPEDYVEYQTNMTYLETLRKLDRMIGFDHLPDDLVIHDFN
jgi:hypothetical protein